MMSDQAHEDRLSWADPNRGARRRLAIAAMVSAGAAPVTGIRPALIWLLAMSALIAIDRLWVSPPGRPARDEAPIAWLISVGYAFAAAALVLSSRSAGMVFGLIICTAALLQTLVWDNPRPRRLLVNLIPPLATLAAILAAQAAGAVGLGQPLQTVTAMAGAILVGLVLAWAHGELNRQRRVLADTAARDQAAFQARETALRTELAETRQREQAAVDAEARLLMMLDHAPDLILWSAADGAILHASPAIRRLGYEAETVIGRRFDDFVEVEFGDPADPSGRRDHLVCTANGDRLWMESHAAIVEAPDGGAATRVTTYRDVTARRLREDAAGAATAPALAAEGQIEGYVDAVSHAHVSGWIYDFSAPDLRLQHQVLLDDTGEVLLEALADRFTPGLREHGVGDGAHGFYHRLPRRLSPAEQSQLRVRVAPDGLDLKRSAAVSTVYQPLAFVVMDIVDNCNLRCPFCLYDYSGVNKTNLMTEQTIEAALRFAPFAADGGFWYSCLHEPTMHPRFVDYLNRMPPEQRRTIFFTTNLARRMPADYYDFLANSGVHHINVSIESRDPAIYERMRKGARSPIFNECWDKLLTAFRAAAAAPRLRYITMAYKSNLREIPSLVEYLLAERCGAEVEIRYTYDEPHIDPAFRRAEYLDQDEWLWLHSQLAPRLGAGVMLSMPPDVEALVAGAGGFDATAGPTPVAIGGFTPGQYGFRLTWDGSLEVKRVWHGPGEPDPKTAVLVETNVRDIPDAAAFLAALPI